MEKLTVTPMVILMTLFIILSLGIAGCASQAPPASPVSPVPSSPTAAAQKLSTLEPSRMALQPSEVPAGFTLVEQSGRNLSDMRSWAVDKGWKKGHYAYYEKNGRDARYIEQAISVYPPGNISLIVPDTVQGIRNWSAEENLTVEELPVPGIGDSSRALKVFKTGEPETDYIITFVKYDVFEQMSINGTATDYETLKQVAGTAAAKIQ
jgi:hypothetical protein